MVEFVKYPLLVMGASMFIGKFTDGITVEEAVNECIENSFSENGSIGLATTNSKGLYCLFYFNEKQPEDKYYEYKDIIGNHRVLSIDAILYRMPMTFYVRILFKEVN